MEDSGVFRDDGGAGLFEREILQLDFTRDLQGHEAIGLQRHRLRKFRGELEVNLDHVTGLKTIAGSPRTKLARRVRRHQGTGQRDYGHQSMG